MPTVNILDDGKIEVRSDDGRSILLASNLSVYVNDIIARFDQLYWQVIPKIASAAPDGVVDFSYPHPHIMRDTGLAFHVSSFPEISSVLSDYTRYYTPKNGDIVYDLGAYCGQASYLFSQMVGPAGRVLAVEPDYTNYQMLLSNIERYSLTNVIPIRAAVSALSGTVEFNAEGATGSFITGCSGRQTVGQTYTITSYSLEELFGRFGAPQFIKMDIEGEEINLLAASIRVITGKQIHWAIDTSHCGSNSGAPSYSHVQFILVSCGYDARSESILAGAQEWMTWASPTTG